MSRQDSLLRPIRGPLALAGGLQALSSLASLVPFIAVVEIGRALLAGDQPVWGWVWAAVLAMFVRVLAWLAAGGLTHLLDVEFSLRLRGQIAAHLGLLPLARVEQQGSAEIRTLVQDDVTSMHHLVAHSVTDLTAAVVTPIAGMVYLFTVDWRMAVITLVPLVLVVGSYGIMMRGAGEMMLEYRARVARLSAAVVEFIRGISVVKAFGESRRAHQRFRDEAEGYADFFQGYVARIARVGTVSELIGSALPALLLISAAGTAMISAGSLAPIDLLPFLLLGLMITTPVTQIGYSVEEVTQARAASARLRAFLDTTPLTVNNPQEVALPAQGTGSTATVEFRGVRYNYDTDRQGSDAVSGVDLRLLPGTVTALVGSSGSGKSTLARLLPRFDDVTEGAILLNGRDIRTLHHEELYGSVSFVFQDAQLLRLSIRDNIALARPDAAIEDVMRAGHLAQIHDRIMELPKRYDSIVGTDVTLSGGEAQRVAIARAILAARPVLVLDEATAYADPESETALQDALGALVEGRCLLVIAHRLRSIMLADQIAVMDRGRVVEVGRHDELLARDGRYARLWHAQEAAGNPTAATTGGTR